MTTTSSSGDTEYLSVDSSIVPRNVKVSGYSKQHTANMSKRRFRQSELYREKVTLNEVDRIRNIFEATALESTISSQPPRRPPRGAMAISALLGQPLDKAVRLSAHKTDSDYLIERLPVSASEVLPWKETIKARCSKQIHLTADLFLEAPSRIQPKSSSSTPSRIPRPIHQVSAVDLNVGEDSDADDLHSTHGVPLIFPIRKSETSILQKASSVAQWLQGVETSGLDGVKKQANKYTAATAKRSPTKIKGKENYSPRGIKAYSAQVASTIPLTGAHVQELRGDNKPSKPVKKTPQLPILTGSPLSKSTPATGLLLLPPRRKGQTPGSSVLPLNIHTTSQPVSLPSKLGRCHYIKAENTDILAEQVDQDEMLIELSPSVNRYRKHRSRCKNARNKDSKLLVQDPFFDPGFADLIYSLEAHDREEGEQRGRKVHRP